MFGSSGIAAGCLSSQSVQYLSFFCEAFSWTILDSSSFPLFSGGQVFHELVCPLTVVLPQIFLNLTILFPCPVFICLFHAPLDVIVHFLVFLGSFRFESFCSLSVLSSCRADQEFLQWPRFFSSNDVCQGSNWLFQSLLCWRWLSLISCLHLHYWCWWEVQTSWLS